MRLALRGEGAAEKRKDTDRAGEEANMIELFKQLLEDAKTVYRDMSRTQHAAVMTLILTVASLLLFAAYLGSHTEAAGLVPLPITVQPQDSKEIIEKLENHKLGPVTYKSDNKIWVPVTKAEEAVVFLGQENLIPPGSELGFQETFDKMPWSTTREEREDRLLVARANEVARLLEKIDCIKEAKVIYNDASKTGIFAINKKQTATVMVVTNLGKQLNDSIANTIVNIVSGAKNGLLPKDVMITDQRGKHYRVDDPSDLASMSAKQFEQEKANSDDLRDRIENLLIAAKPGCVPSVFVDVTMDFDFYEEHNLVYGEGVPIQKNTSKTSSSNSKTPGGEVGTKTNIIGRSSSGGGGMQEVTTSDNKESQVTMTPDKKETVKRQVPSVVKRTITAILQLPYVYKREKDKDGKEDWVYEAGADGSPVLDSAGNKLRKKFTADPLPTERLAQLKRDVAKAAGIALADIDSLIELDQVAYPESQEWAASAPAATTQLWNWFRDNVVPFMMLAFVICLALLIVRQLKRSLPTEKIELPEDLSLGLDSISTLSDEDKRNTELEAIRTKVADAVAEDPRKAANLVRKWMTREGY